MRAGLPLLVVLLAACSGQARTNVEKEPAPQPAQPDPIVTFRLQIIRDWDSTFFVVESEDHDFTMAQAVAFGIPEALWVRAAMVTGPDQAYSIYWVRPIRA